MAYDRSDHRLPGTSRVGRDGRGRRAGSVVAADSLGRALLGASAAAITYPGGPTPPRYGGTAAMTPDETARRAVALADAVLVDAEAVAAWIVAHYPAPGDGSAHTSDASFPAVVIGSPHGAAAHLAATLGGPWLPAGFEFAVRWPGGAVADPVEALNHGLAVTRRVLAANPDLAVRQVHDPVLRGRAAGTTVTLVARWRRLPRAYREFLAGRLRPGAPVLLVSDARSWPAFDLGDRASFQLGSPIAGLEPEDYLAAGPDLRQALRLAGGDPDRWCPLMFAPMEEFAEHGPEQGFEADLRALAAASGRPAHTVLYPRPSALSAAVAEAIRAWLADEGKLDDRLAVECGRLLDPAQTLRSGLVPYWCESALRAEVSDAEWWLAGSRPFRSIDVLVEPPGRPSSVIAPAPQWSAIARFGGARGAVDRAGLRDYPYGALSTRHASLVLGGHFDDLPQPAPLDPDAAVKSLTIAGRPLGLLVA
jgi:hypothetical protein